MFERSYMIYAKRIEKEQRAVEKNIITNVGGGSCKVLGMRKIVYVLRGSLEGIMQCLRMYASRALLPLLLDREV